jgi:hypothetical protein
MVSAGLPASIGNAMRNRTMFVVNCYAGQSADGSPSSGDFWTSAAEVSTEDEVLILPRTATLQVMLITNFTMRWLE